MRPNNFDLIRLLAALQVVYCHTTHHLKVDHGIGDPTLSYVINWFQGVPIFFTISGFLISRSWERSTDIRDYAKKRALRIYPALWLQLAVGIALATVFGEITRTVVMSKGFYLWVAAQVSFLQFYNPDFLRGFGNGALNGSVWTIPVELGFYIAIPVIYRLVIARSNRLWADCQLAALALVSFAYWFYLSTYADGQSRLVKLQLVTPFPHIYMFLFGVIAQRNFERLLPFIENQIITWLVLFSVYMTMFNPWGREYLSPSPAAVLGGRALLAVTALSFAFSWRSLAERLLRENDISYGIYLYHGLIINVLLELGWTGQQSQVGFVFAITAVLATLSWWAIEYPALQTVGRVASHAGGQAERSAVSPVPETNVPTSAVEKARIERQETASIESETEKPPVPEIRRRAA
jgi:peptidoglycan/LPS O-acetylase OafA/YrhL